jgi:hypothetical protein
MTLKIRHDVVEDQYCSFNSASGETLPIAAGTLVYVMGETSDGRALVDVISDSSAQEALGFLMQEIKAESAELPPNYRFRSDMGASHAYLGDPVAVAHGHGAVYETDQYVDNGSNGIAAGTVLYIDDDGKLEDTLTDAGPKAAIALNSLSIPEVAAGKLLRIKALV